MNACSSEARRRGQVVQRGCRWRTRCRRSGLGGRPRTSSSPGPPAGGHGAARGRDRPGQRVRLRRPDQHGLAGAAGDELGHAAVGDEPAPPDHDQVIGGVLHLRHQVAGHEHRAALGGQRPHQGADPQDALRIQPVDRLVEHQDLRVTEQRRGDAEPLAHAERESLGPLPGHVGQPDEAEHLVHPALAGCRWSGPGSAGGCGRCGRRARPGRPAARPPRASGLANCGYGWPLMVTVPALG